MDEPKETLPPPEPVGGLMHIFAAAKYSAGGFAVLAQETAFKLELACAFVLYGLFAFFGAQAEQYLVLTVLALLVIGFEALNTAIELIVDEISPHRSEFARKTKDLGSLAVACMQIATGLYAAYVIGGIALG
ncbi:MAG: diacylglycerol kinase [Rhizobiaceae bacterium]